MLVTVFRGPRTVRVLQIVVGACTLVVVVVYAEVMVRVWVSVWAKLALALLGWFQNGSKISYPAQSLY